MKLLIKTVGVALALMITMSACTEWPISAPISATATPSIASPPGIDDPMPKAYYLVMSHDQVANASGGIIDGVIDIYAEFVQGLSKQEQRSVLEELAQKAADAAGMVVELTAVDDAGGFD